MTNTLSRPASITLLMIALLTVTGLSAEPIADLVVDHVTVAGMDLKQMQTRLATVGIRSEYGGPHANRATEMAIASFPDGSYLELIAPQKNPDAKALAAHYWSRQMRDNAGPTAWAVRSSDNGAESSRLRRAGIVVSPPVRSGRTRPDGVRLEWETAEIGEEPNGTFFPFMIHDITPRELRAFPNGQPTAKDFTSVKRVVIAVRDLKSSVARYRRAYGLPAAVEQNDPKFGARLASFADTPVILAAPLESKSWLAVRIRQAGESPCAFVLGALNDAARTNAQGAKSGPETRWFGAAISWLDGEELGWRLGVEK